MNSRKLLFWSFFLCVLLLYVYLFELKVQTNEKSPAKKIDRIFSFSPETITTIKILNDNRQIIIDHHEGMWELIPPYNRQVNREAVESVVSSIVDLARVGVIEGNGYDLHQYGLDDPEFVISVYDKTAKKPAILLLGKEAPAGTQMYAMLEGQNRVILVGTFIRFSLKSFMKNFFEVSTLNLSLLKG